MKSRTKTSRHENRIGFLERRIRCFTAIALMSGGWLGTALALPVVETLGGGPNQANPNPFGYMDGDTRTVAQFNAPVGLAFATDPSVGPILYVADRTNNAVRKLELGQNLTITFTTNGISAPIGVVVDGGANVYVLNYGNGRNGTVLKFNRYGNLLATNVSGLTNVGGIALDGCTNLFLTVNSNTIIKVTPQGVKSTVATIGLSGTWLRGITVTPAGELAACDAGNHGIWIINPITGTATPFTGFCGAGDGFGVPGSAKFNQPWGIAADGNGNFVVADYGNHRVKVVDPLGNVCSLYGVCSNDWVSGPGMYPGWWDGSGCPCETTCQICNNYAEARNPAAVAIGPDGSVYTTEIYYHIIRRTTGAGLASPQAGCCVPPLFSGPMGVALNTSGTLVYVADFTNSAVRVLNLQNNQTTTFLGWANGIRWPVDVVVDRNNNIYVLNLSADGTGSVLEFDSFGNLLWESPAGLVHPVAMLVGDYGEVVIAELGGVVKRWNGSAFQTVVTITNLNVSLGGIAFFSDGTLAVSDTGNHVIWQVNALAGTYTRLTGSVGVPGNTLGSSAFAKLNQPRGLASAAGDKLVVADAGNNRVVVVERSGAITNVLNSTNALVWFGRQGDPVGTNSAAWVQMRQPVDVVVAPGGTVFVCELFYNNIRGILGTGLTPPPTPPAPAPVTPPAIGWVDFVADAFGVQRSVLRVGESFTFNNDVIIAIRAEPGTVTYYTYGPTPVGVDTIPSPGPSTGSTPPYYADGMAPWEVPTTLVSPMPDITIKAISTQAGRPDSPVVKARFQFVTANPVIIGDNAALFRLENITTGAEMWYTWDGTDPTNGPPSIGPVYAGAQISTNLTTGTATFKVRAFKPGYAPSGVAMRVFSATNYVANKICFGFEGGEASSDFVGAPGQFFYAPVTMVVLPDASIYSLQFNLTVTNVGDAPPVLPGHYNFMSMLVKPMPDGTYTVIPPLMYYLYASNPPPTHQIVWYEGKPFVNMVFTNTAINLLGVGWLERKCAFCTNLYNTPNQDLITYSMAHDTLFEKKNGKVIVGGYAFQIPTNAVPGQQYRIQIGRPSATSDGVGAPGSDVYIETPTNGSLTAGPINSIKLVTVGHRGYIVGDCYPFRWFNAGDFGKGYLVNADVMQVFQSAIYRLNYPQPGSDFEDSMDSCCGTFTLMPGMTDVFIKDTDVTDVATLNALFDGNDTNINAIAFGDGALDVCDVYVTYRRSLDPTLVWFQRFWTNGVRAARYATNNFRGNIESLYQQASLRKTNAGGALTPVPAVAINAGDVLAAAGQTVTVPITAEIHGQYPIRIMMLNVTVEPLDGSPPVTTPVQFVPNVNLGTPTLTITRSPANYGAAWLNPGSSGLNGSNVVGYLNVVVPTNANAAAAYAVHFEHFSASPNGIAPFAKHVRTGLITLSDRSGSSWGDGIPDSWRLRYFGSINNVLSAATADADGDGLSNIEEFRAGTDPNDCKSNFKLRSTRGEVGGHEIVIRWPSAVGKQYVVEVSPSVYGPLWIPVATNTGTGFDLEYRDTQLNPGARFYRVRLLP